jgi:hypothetical protein
MSERAWPSNTAAEGQEEHLVHGIFNPIYLCQPNLVQSCLQLSKGSSHAQPVVVTATNQSHLEASTLGGDG